MEIAILGLQNAGKSSFTGKFEDNMIPTVGFNMHKVQKGKVTIKVWDMGGQVCFVKHFICQKKFRGMWERFVVDASDQKSFGSANNELKVVGSCFTFQGLLSKPTVSNIPLLVLLNKNDASTAVKPELVVKELELDSIKGRDISYYSISCKNLTNIDKTLDWIIKRAAAAKKK